MHISLFFPTNIMKITLIKSQPLYHLNPIITPKSLNFHHTNLITPYNNPPQCLRNFTVKSKQQHQEITVTSSVEKTVVIVENEKEMLLRRLVITGGAASIVFLVMMMMGHDKAWALGPEGPLMEEFWENVRRYALYALTVSTGVIYSVFQPIYELLRNPISAILVLIIIGGTFYIGSQVLYAMVGISDFDYQYAY